MVYTEIVERGKKKYYYRIKSIRKGDKVEKRRVYLGVNLNKKSLSEKEKGADKELGLLSSLLSKEQINVLKLLKNYLIRNLSSFFPSMI